jgi:hypothetical protein
MVPFRFEVTLNGRVLCVAGMDRTGIVLVTVESENWPGPASGESGRGTPAGEENTVFVNGYTDDDDDWRWVRERIHAGDEIRIRVLPTGPYDPPTKVLPPCDAGEDEG